MQYRNKKYQGFYNVGPDDCDCVTTGDLVNIFCDKWGDGLKWIDQSDDGPHEADFLKLDCAKIKKVFYWQPTWHIEEAIQKTVEWTRIWLNNGNISECMDDQILNFFKTKNLN